MSEAGQDFRGRFAQANAWFRAGDLAAAEAAYRELTANEPGHVALLNNFAALLRRRGAADEARGLLERAIAIEPAATDLHRNLGNLERDLGRLDAAEAAYRGELAHHPGDDQAAVELAAILLAKGAFGEAWSLLERRTVRAKAAARGMTGPEWRGEPLAGKRLMLWPEQGFGDQLMMMRFVPRLGVRPLIVCRPELARLFGQLPADILPLQDRLPEPAYDYWTLPLSLPLWLQSGDDLATAPLFTGTPRRSGGVGVAWRGNALPDPNRSLPDELGAELLAMPGAVSLHPEDSGARDFKNTADLIAGLDLVVSIDTSVAHLAGAMGKRTWVLRPYPTPEWRWRTGADGQSVWHPSATVFHQPAPGQWRPLIDRLKADWPIR